MAFLYFAVPISPSRPFLDTNGRQLPAILGTLPGSKGARDIPVYEHGIFASHLVPRYHIHGNTLNAIEWISLVNVLLDVFHCLCWNLKNTTKWAAPPQKKCDTIGDLCFFWHSYSATVYWVATNSQRWYRAFLRSCNTWLHPKTDMTKGCLRSRTVGQEGDISWTRMGVYGSTGCRWLNCHLQCI